MDGIFTAKDAGLKIKLNMVALRGVNDDEIAEMLLFVQKMAFYCDISNIWAILT